ncbi:hypothetical protein FB451DRAFT_1454293 [Mycena latifolia]|nr:hypothetical protein FB451DRAFT_1454293 [Mycena latifolia]
MMNASRPSAIARMPVPPRRIPPVYGAELDLVCRFGVATSHHGRNRTIDLSLGSDAHDMSMLPLQALNKNINHQREPDYPASKNKAINKKKKSAGNTSGAVVGARVERAPPGGILHIVPFAPGARRGNQSSLRRDGGICNEPELGGATEAEEAILPNGEVQERAAENDFRGFPKMRRKARIQYGASNTAGMRITRKLRSGTVERSRSAIAGREGDTSSTPHTPSIYVRCSGDIVDSSAQSAGPASNGLLFSPSSPLSSAFPLAVILSSVHPNPARSRVAPLQSTSSIASARPIIAEDMSGHVEGARTPAVRNTPHPDTWEEARRAQLQAPPRMIAAFRRRARALMGGSVHDGGRCVRHGQYEGAMAGASIHQGVHPLFLEERVNPREGRAANAARPSMFVDKAGPVLLTASLDLPLARPVEKALFSAVSIYSVISQGDPGFMQAVRPVQRISTATTAVEGQQITSFHAAVILDLSWMNNTSTWIWFLLYAHHLSKADKGKDHGTDWKPRCPRCRLERGRNPILATWSDWAPVVLSSKACPRHFRARSGPALVLRIVDRAWDLFSRAPVLILGSFHLSLMAAVGIWLWLNPVKFGAPMHCDPTLTIVGGPAHFSSPALRIFSLAMYFLLLIPGINLLPPIFFFLVLHIAYNRSLEHQRSSWERWDRCIQSIRRTLGRKRSEPEDGESQKVHTAFLVVGLVLLVVINIVFLVDIELTLSRNKHHQSDEDNLWGFGQVLALLLLVMPLRDAWNALRDIQEALRGVQQQFHQGLREEIAATPIIPPTGLSGAFGSSVGHFSIHDRMGEAWRSRGGDAYIIPGVMSFVTLREGS